MLESLSIFVPGSRWVVSEVYFILFLPRAQHDIAGFDLVVNKVFEVEVLQNGDQLLAKHKSCLLSELTTTKFMKLLHWSIEFLQHDEVVVLLLAAPVHMRHPHPSLHDLKDFALLQDGQHLVIRPQFVLLPLHEHRLLGLSMHSLVEEMLVLPRYLGGKPEPPDQSHFDGPHRNYRIVNISNSKSYQNSMAPKSKKKTKVSL